MQWWNLNVDLTDRWMMLVAVKRLNTGRLHRAVAVAYYSLAIDVRRTY